MNHFYDNQERQRLAQARDSYSGRLLTDAQFDEAVAITGVIEREILKNGKFKEKLGDYAYAFSRTEKFDALKGEEIIRDLFKARTGQTMNQLRESLMVRENDIDRRDDTGLDRNAEGPRDLSLSISEKDQAYRAATDAGRMVKEGNKMPWHRAYRHQAATLARELGTTDRFAGTVMDNQFRHAENQPLYDWGKALEEKYYRPQIEAEAKAREANRGEETVSRETRTHARAR